MSIEKIKEIIKNSNNIVFFGGAGVSTESNIPDFRSQTGLYTTKSGYSHPPEVMLSHSFFEENPEEFFRFYKEKMIYTNAKPNSAHYSLVKLEALGKLSSTITQNIDGLHQAAGSRNVIELHGSVYRNYCTSCGATYDLDYTLNSTTVIPKCEKCGGIVRPDVTLYEEALNNNVIVAAILAVKNADVLIVGGTSLVVYPAAGLINYYKGNKLILINKGSTSYDRITPYIIKDSIGPTLQYLVSSL